MYKTVLRGLTWCVRLRSRLPSPYYSPRGVPAMTGETNKHVLAQMRADEKGTTKDEEMAQAEKDAHKIAVAVNRWVARAIMAPNAALRPSRASDPHYAMFFQLKSFTYAFTETTLKYAMAEAEEGNLNAGAQLMRGVPIMIAADMTKA